MTDKQKQVISSITLQQAKVVGGHSDDRIMINRFTSSNPNLKPKKMELGDAVWYIMRFGGYDKNNWTVSKLEKHLTDTLSSGGKIYTEFSYFQKI